MRVEGVVVLIDVSLIMPFSKVLLRDVWQSLMIFHGNVHSSFARLSAVVSLRTDLSKRTWMLPAMFASSLRTPKAVLPWYRIMLQALGCTVLG